MSWLFTIRRYGTLISLLLLCSGLVCPSAERDSHEILETSTAANVDERLFLVLLLKQLHSFFPVDAPSASSFEERVQYLRSVATDCHEQIQRSELDKELDEAYTDFLGFINAYSRFLTRLEGVSFEVAQRAKSDHLRSGSKGLLGAASGYYLLKDSSPTEALIGALLAGGIELIRDAKGRASERESMQTELQRQAIHEISAHAEQVVKRTRQAAEALARRHGWRSTEAGWDFSVRNDQDVQRMEANGDWHGLVRHCDRLIARRPLDPFVRLAKFHFCMPLAPTTTEGLMDLANECLATAKLYPTHRIYDELRSAPFVLAARFAQQARLREALSGINPTGKTKTGAFAVRAINTALKYSPSDEDGSVRQLKLLCLLGNDDLDAALQTAREIVDICRGESSFSYAYACLMSRKGSEDNALVLLRRAFQQGFSDVSFVKKDPDFESLRKTRASAFNAMLQVNCRWRIQYGIFNDDIILSNESLFPMTNVRLKLFLEQDAKRWNLDLQAPVILPGEQHTWTDAVSIPGSRLTGSRSVLICDQASAK